MLKTQWLSVVRLLLQYTSGLLVRYDSLLNCLLVMCLKGIKQCGVCSLVL